jgi:hypothetical protein
MLELIARRPFDLQMQRSILMWTSITLSNVGITFRSGTRSRFDAGSCAPDISVMPMDEHAVTAIDLGTHTVS